MINMSEAQAFISLPTFLDDPSETQFHIDLNGASCHDCVASWTESKQYLSLIYAARCAMRIVIEDLRNIRRNEDDKEDEYRKRLNEAKLVCGKVHSEEEKITLYVDGLSPNSTWWSHTMARISTAVV